MVNRRQFFKALATCGAAGVIAPELLQQIVAAAQTLPLYPYLQDVRGDRAKVMWTTLESGTGMILYSRDNANYLISRADRRPFPTTETQLAAPFYQHKAELTDMAASAEYSCRLALDGTTVPLSNPIRVLTPGPGPFAFLAFGDSGMATGAQRVIAQLMGRESAALVVHTGDIAYMDGTYEQFQDRHFHYYWEMMCRVPFFPCPGNHEYHTSNAAPYLALHSVPTENVPLEDHGRYYSFDWGNAHFISLDSNAPLAKAASGLAGGGMLKWLESDLQQSQKFWRIVYFHHPPYATGNNVRDPLSALVRDYVVPILDRHEVELVLNGHEHSYQRSYPLRNGRIVESGKGVVYIVTGGGGADLYAVPPGPFLAMGERAYNYVRGAANGHRLTLDAIRSDGNRIDTVTLQPPPSIASAYPLADEIAQLSLPREIGGLLHITGRHLAAEDTPVTSLPLPTQLSNVSVELGGRPLGLVDAGSTKLIAALPAGLDGEKTLKVSTPNGTAEMLVWIAKKGTSRRR